MFLKKIVGVSLCFIGWIVSAHSQTLSLETLTSYPFPSALTSASSASNIALAINVQGQRNIFVGEGPAFKLRKLTSYTTDNGDEITGVKLSPKGDWVVYVKGGDHGAFNESEVRNPASAPLEPKVQVWSVPFAGGKPICLADGDYPIISPDGKRVVFEKGGQLWVVPIDGSKQARPLFFAKGNNGSPQWSPDGSKIAFVSNRGDHSLIGVFEDSQTPIQWLVPDFSSDQSPCWSPDGRSIVFVRAPAKGGAPDSLTVTRPQPWSIWRVDLADGNSNRLWSAPNTLEGSVPGTHGGFNLHWAAKDRIVFLSYQDGWPHLYSVAAKGGDALLLTPGNFMVEHVQLSPDRNWVLFSANTGEDSDDVDRRHLYQVPVDRPILQALTKGKNIESFPMLMADGNQLIYIQSSATQPPMPAMMSIGEQSNVQLLGEELLPTSLINAKLVQPKRVEFEAADGETVYAQLFEPENSNQKHPAILFVHGGPQRQMLLGWHYGDYYANTYALNQYLVRKGFVVLSVNYRLGIGYGYHFHKPANAGRFGASEYQDIKAAGEWLAKSPIVDAKRIGVYGGSYGGFLTALALAKDADLFAAGVDIHGVHNYMGRISTNAPEPAPDVELAIELAKNSSPVSWLGGWTSPALIIHGDDDGNVDFHQSVDLIERLKKRNAPIETLMIPDETHHWMRYENQLKVDRAVVTFFEEKLMKTN
ncbi:S9 family peptidase [Olivibacter domesticus]|uniref:Acyl-peptide hydrolase n=1 Tax=Olivibacter domesticus TaxID=407022 RepID=A0A1H7W8Y9_OLID1|nr:prolyl oligopeptidase family serine peptidase [Olivibacter domesticus]SEM17468.1 Dipeptidyl aminopeptidase/acylaminoacyl peptidase [Olivibacter domesticus]